MAKKTSKSRPVIKKKAAFPSPKPSKGATPAAEQKIASPLTSAIVETLNAKQSAVRRSKAKEAHLRLRKELWPEVGADSLWLRNDRKRVGFTTMPRTMPLFMEIIDNASKQVTNGKSVPAGRSYLVLWCRVFDEGFLKIDGEAAAALEAGYSGERNVSTWREHLRVLRELGFIDVRPGSGGPFQFILLWDPYDAVKRLRAKGWVQDLAYTSLVQRAIEVGATELTQGAG